MWFGLSSPLANYGILRAPPCGSSCGTELADNLHVAVYQKASGNDLSGRRDAVLTTLALVPLERDFRVRHYEFAEQRNCGSLPEHSPRVHPAISPPDGIHAFANCKFSRRCLESSSNAERTWVLRVSFSPPLSNSRIPLAPQATFVGHCLTNSLNAVARIRPMAQIL